MSNDDKIHEIIERQNPEKKEKAWKQLEGRLGLDTPGSTAEKRGKSSRARTLLCACASVVILSAAVFAGVCMASGGGFSKSPDQQAQLSDGTENLSPKEDSDNANGEASEGASEEGGGRYCTQEDFYIVASEEMTIKAYGEQIGAELLYFDRYDSAEHVDYIYSDPETKEVLLLREMIELETGEITLCVVKNDVRPDFLETIRETCFNETAIDGVAVFWGVRYPGGIVSRWEYKGFQYYLFSGSSDENGLLVLLKELFGHSVE